MFSTGKQNEKTLEKEPDEKNNEPKSKTSNQLKEISER